MVSFNIAAKDQDDEPYALFGGVNSTQIVGGVDGLKTFANFPNFLGTWALEGQLVQYDGQTLQETIGSFPAIIDTGTSQMQLPPRIFAEVLQQWNAAAQGQIKCESDSAFCTSEMPCDEMAKKLKPISMQLSGVVFKMEPKQYLWQVDGGQCFFILSENKLTGKNRDIYILGGAFLKHFYSAYDFDANRLSLGINTHSQGLVSIESGQAMSKNDAPAADLPPGQLALD